MALIVLFCHEESVKVSTSLPNCLITSATLPLGLDRITSFEHIVQTKYQVDYKCLSYDFASRADIP